MVGVNSSSMPVGSDDDLGSYRSLSTCAVLSLILGLLSLLSFAPTNLFLWIVPPAAIVTGVIALRQITTAPDVWTGRRLAQLGIALAVVCAGGAIGERCFTYTRIARNGRAVADRFIGKLKEDEIEAAFWLTIPHDQRQIAVGKRADELPSQAEERYGNFRSEIESGAASLNRSDVTVEFEGIEATGNEHGVDFASLVYRIHSPTGDSRVLIIASASAFDSHDTYERSWIVRSHKFDYTAGSFVSPAASGHGHAH